MGECKSKVCNRPVHSGGYCSGHYQRFIRGADVDTPLRMRRTKEQKRQEETRVEQQKVVGRKRSSVVAVKLMTPLPDQQVAIDKLRKVHFRLCGDSMGVGKTITGIGLDFAMREDYPELEDGPTLIISEKIGLDVWDYHLKAMGVPSEQILLINPADRSEFEAELEHLLRYQKDQPRGATRGANKTKRPPYRYYVLHWDVLIRIPLLSKITWAHIIGDEIHLIKNRKALRTVAVKRIKAENKTGLSGTPADDKPWDIWSVLHWLYPKVHRSYWRFYEDHVLYVASSELSRYNKWIKNGGDYDSYRETYPTAGGGYRTAVGVKNIPELHRVIRPFYIRRTLREVAPDMPEKIHVQPPLVVPMAARQRKEYEQMRDKAIALIGASMDGVGGFQLLAPAVVAVLTRLQQMALATLSPEWEASDDEWVGDDFETEWDFPKIVLSKPSPKLDAVMNLITTHEEEPFVVFTQFRGMADLVEEECHRLKIPVVKIHGGVLSKDRRTELVRQFQDGEARVFVGTIAAAGKTITLTRANHEIFTDLHWNPSKNEQAEDRLWRRTQRNTVRVYHIQSEDSIDQIRLERINQKADWIDALLNPNEQAQVAEPREMTLAEMAMHDAQAMVGMMGGTAWVRVGDDT